MSWVFPYLYHTALVEKTLARAGGAPSKVLDWGAFLEVSLYQEALIHFLGGESRTLHK